jgi:hypothetical protein
MCWIRLVERISICVESVQNKKKDFIPHILYLSVSPRDIEGIYGLRPHSDLQVDVEEKETHQAR